MLSRHTTPFDLFDRLEQQLSQAERVPAAEVLETDEGFSIAVEMPGIDRDSIDVKATDRSLTVNAERPCPQEDEAGSQRQLSEFRYGTWSRSFRFPHSLNRDQLKASYRDGILEIRAGKAVEHTSVSVKIEN